LETVSNTLHTLVVDLMLGGGRCHFLPNTTEGSCRGDDRDITKLAQDKYDWTYIDNKKAFDRLESGNAVKLPLLGLFAGSDFPFEIDRRNMEDQYPSLDEMARTALKALEAATQDSDKGFFLMIEGSRIDHAGHGNDPVAQVHEVLAYDRAMASVVEFLERSDIDGVFIATSDHETGGLAIARRRFRFIPWISRGILTLLELHPTYPQYKWFPEFLGNASHSAEYLARQLNSRIGQGVGGDDLKEYIVSLVQKGLGIQDASDAEIQSLIDQPLLSVYTFADMISRRAQIGWSTHGHSAVDVNIYGSAGTDALRGNHENTEIGVFLRKYLDVDVDAITEELVKKSKTFSIANGDQASWTGRVPTEADLQMVERHYEKLFREAPWMGFSLMKTL
jgi:alkaline phosphatase